MGLERLAQTRLDSSWFAPNPLLVRFILAWCGQDVTRTTPVSAARLAVISLLGIALYVRYAEFPGMLWGAVPAILAAFVAYERWR